MDLKFQMLNAICCVIKNISGSFNILCHVPLDYYYYFKLRLTDLFNKLQTHSMLMTLNRNIYNI